jgi:hypothetical protein
MRHIAAQIWAQSGSCASSGGFNAFFVGAWPRVMKKALSSALTCEIIVYFIACVPCFAARGGGRENIVAVI